MAAARVEIHGRGQRFERDALVLNAAGAQLGVDDWILQCAAQRALRAKLAATVLREQAQVFRVDGEAQVHGLRDAAIGRERGAAEHEAQLFELPHVLVACNVPGTGGGCTAQAAVQPANVHGEIVGAEADAVCREREVEFAGKIIPHPTRIDPGGITRY